MGWSKVYNSDNKQWISMKFLTHIAFPIPTYHHQNVRDITSRASFQFCMKIW